MKYTIDYEVVINKEVIIIAENDEEAFEKFKLLNPVEPPLKEQNIIVINITREDTYTSSSHHLNKRMIY